LSSSRGDVQFLIGNSQWRGSRGENKLVGILLQLSVQQMALAGQASSPVVLLDDPYAELSGRHIEPLLEAWMQVSEQVFVTSLDDVPGAELRRRHPATFHVEQGALTGL
jgi:recombinational DNA repair ATPase RecF